MIEEEDDELTFDCYWQALVCGALVYCAVVILALDLGSRPGRQQELFVWMCDNWHP